MVETFESQLARYGLLSNASKLRFHESITSISIDVGCSSGHLMQEWLERQEGLYAVGIEPNPESAKAARQLLSERFGQEGVRWVVLDGALGSSDEVVRLFVPNDSPDQGSLLRPENMDRVLSFEVQVETLSKLLTLVLGDRISEVDFLKTDCQGLDFEVLKSAGILLRRVKIITAEADSKGYQGATNSIDVISDYLANLGFLFMNRRSKMRRVIGDGLVKARVGPKLGLKLPNFSRGQSLAGPSFRTEDPTFVNLAYLDEVRAGKVLAYQVG